MCCIFTLTTPSPLHNIRHPTRQVMRKKPDSTGGVSNKIIAKPSRSKSTTVLIAGRKDSTLSTNPPPIQNDNIIDSTNDIGIHTTDGVNDTSPASSRDRSPTPTESDLLRYLTAHISPINTESGFYIDVTSFVIGRDEYLQGIVRLIQSDCPEVSDDMKGFVEAMQQAFVAVKGS